MEDDDVRPLERPNFSNPTFQFPELSRYEKPSGWRPSPSIAVSIVAKPYEFRNSMDIPPREWLYGRQLLRRSLSLLIAPGGAGKTALMTGMALALATGRPLLKAQCNQPCRVWLWNLEDSLEELTRLIQAGCKYWQISSGEIEGRLFVNSGLDGDTLTLAASDLPNEVNTTALEKIGQELKEKQIDVLLIDPFVSAHRLNENDNPSIDRVAKSLSQLASMTNTAILVAHHSRKMNGAETTTEASRGASSLTNAARSVTVLNGMSNSEAKRYGVEETQRRRFFRAYDDKNNRAPPTRSDTWYELVSIDLGQGDEAPAVVPWTASISPIELSAAEIEAIHAQVASGLDRKDGQADQWVGKAIANVLKLPNTSPTDRRRINEVLVTLVSEGFLNWGERRDRTGQLRPCVVLGKVPMRGTFPPENLEVETGGDAESNATNPPPPPP